MARIPSYMKEYAEAQRKSYLSAELMQEKYKKMAVKCIDEIVKCVKDELITVNEGMQLLCSPVLLDPQLKEADMDSAELEKKLMETFREAVENYNQNHEESSKAIVLGIQEIAWCFGYSLYAHQVRVPKKYVLYSYIGLLKDGKVIVKEDVKK